MGVQLASLLEVEVKKVDEKERPMSRRLLLGQTISTLTTIDVLVGEVYQVARFDFSFLLVRKRWQY